MNSTTNNSPITENSIPFNYREEDFREAYAVHQRSQGGWRRYSTLFWGIMITLISLYYLVQKSDGRTTLFLVLVILYGLSLVGFHFWQQKTLGARMFKRFPEFHEPFHLLFTDQMLVLSSPKVSTTMHFSQYQKIYSNDHVLVLYMDSQKFHILPKRIFNDKQYNNLLAGLKKHSQVTEI